MGGRARNKRRRLDHPRHLRFDITYPLSLIPYPSSIIPNPLSLIPYPLSLILYPFYPAILNSCTPLRARSWRVNILFLEIHPFTPNTWHLTPDTWHLTPDTWHLTCDTGWGINFLSKLQISSSYDLSVMMFWRFGKGSLTQLIIYWITKVFVEQPRLHLVC